MAAPTSKLGTSIAALSLFVSLCTASFTYYTWSAAQRDAKKTAAVDLR